MDIDIFQLKQNIFEGYEKKLTPNPLKQKELDQQKLEEQKELEIQEKLKVALNDKNYKIYQENVITPEQKQQLSKEQQDEREKEQEERRRQAQEDREFKRQVVGLGVKQAAGTAAAVATNTLLNKGMEVAGKGVVKTAKIVSPYLKRGLSIARNYIT